MSIKARGGIGSNGYGVRGASRQRQRIGSAKSHSAMSSAIAATSKTTTPKPMDVATAVQMFSNMNLEDQASAIQGDNPPLELLEYAFENGDEVVRAYAVASPNASHSLALKGRDDPEQMVKSHALEGGGATEEMVREAWEHGVESDRNSASKSSAASTGFLEEIANDPTATGQALVNVVLHQNGNPELTANVFRRNPDSTTVKSWAMRGENSSLEITQAGWESGVSDSRHSLASPYATEAMAKEAVGTGKTTDFEWAMRGGGVTSEMIDAAIDSDDFLTVNAAFHQKGNFTQAQAQRVCSHENKSIRRRGMNTAGTTKAMTDAGLNDEEPSVRSAACQSTHTTQAQLHDRIANDPSEEVVREAKVQLVERTQSDGSWK